MAEVGRRRGWRSFSETNRKKADRLKLRKEGKIPKPDEDDQGEDEQNGGNGDQGEDEQ